jgi:hypothetical protein
MKRIVLAIAAVLCSAGMVLAGDLAVAEVTLDSMGLSAMQPLSNHDGMMVRGKGPLDFVFGEGYVPAIGGADFGQNQTSGFSGNPRLPSNPLDRSPLTLDGTLHGSSLIPTSGPSFSDLFGIGVITNLFPSF